VTELSHVGIMLLKSAPEIIDKNKMPG
jgi:hypothetical protein